jgi:hypothetical protein
MAGFDDVAPSISYLFSVPSACPAPHISAHTESPRPKRTCSLLFVSLIHFTICKAKSHFCAVLVVVRLVPRAAPSPAGTPWPLAFHASVAFTGNDFGLPTPTLDHFVQQTLFGTPLCSLLFSVGLCAECESTFLTCAVLCCAVLWCQATTTTIG